MYMFFFHRPTRNSFKKPKDLLHHANVTDQTPFGLFEGRSVGERFPIVMRF